MLRLYDVQAGQPEPVTAAGRGELRILMYGPAAGPRPHLGDLRCFLLPDLIRRCAERRGLQVLSWEVSGAAGEDARAALRAGHAALNIHPPDRTLACTEPAPTFDVATGDGDRAPGPVGVPGLRAAPTAPVTFEGRDMASLAAAGSADADADAGPDASTDTSADTGTADCADGIVWLSDVTGLGLDPLALRLAFLRQRYREQADLTWDALMAADRVMRRWRGRMAIWATEPSAPLARSYADAVTGAFEDDLDTAAALRHLQALEADSAAPPGAKFETFAHLDSLFGLDLARDVGRY